MRESLRGTLLLAATLAGLGRPARLKTPPRQGPGLGRPLVDTVSGSKLPNLKELRSGSVGGSEVRLLFVFDPQRRAVFLVAGDKSGTWSDWYKTAIPQAEDPYAEHLRIEGKK